MNGAESLLNTLARSGVDACFANPGTTEMNLVAALDRVPAMRTLLTLFEGVATGAADGFGRMRGKPAATLLHLGPGFANGIANLHNARRAKTPIVNLVGQHPAHHLPYDSPLTSDIEGLARPVSKWVRSVNSVAGLAEDGAAACAAAQTHPFGIATLIVPSDLAAAENAPPAIASKPPAAAKFDEADIRKAAAALKRARKSMLLLDGEGLSERGLRAAGRIAAATDAKLACGTFFARARRGAGLPAVMRLPYFPEEVQTRLADSDEFILAGAPAPVAFFAYPGKPSALWPETARLTPLTAPESDVAEALEALAEMIGAGKTPAPVQPLARPELPRGKLDTRSAGAAIAALLPDNAILVDEGATSSTPAYVLTGGAPAHDVLLLTGGSIGQGLPLAVGCAVACPDRKVICMEGDGSGFYTIQALWTMARENLDITTIVFANRSYAILNVELFRGGLEAGPKTQSLLSLSNPTPDWVKLSEGFGVEAVRVHTAEDFVDRLSSALGSRGPRLIEVVL